MHRLEVMRSEGSQEERNTPAVLLVDNSSRGDLGVAENSGAVLEGVVEVQSGSRLVALPAAAMVNLAARS
jgi:hypothetical protein